ncbi:MAG: chemotaxis protein CheB [Dokdonella sp.]|uniref:chemotaxis protein CheB n=1 Tax=Dokdonella sp. TaxID=2291710 RepID=UPI0032640802
MSSNESSVAVALLYEKPEDGNLMRDVLRSFGASIVYEALASEFDRAALEQSRASVVVVNLDAQNDPDLDGVYELLDDARYRVVFNESEVSNNLSGFDHARWVRHLAAKVLGADVDPPRPADARPVPAPSVQYTTPIAAPPAPNEGVTRFSASPADVATVQSTPLTTDEWTSTRVGAEPAAGAPSVGDVEAGEVDLIDFDALLEMPGVGPRDSMQSAAGFGESDPPPPLSDAFQIDFDDDSGEFASDESIVQGLEGVHLDEAGLTLGGADGPADAGLTADASDLDLDLDFDLDMDLDAHASVPVSPALDPAEPVVPQVVSAPASWALEFDSSELPLSAPTGRADFGIEKLRAEEYLAPEKNEAAEIEFADAANSSSLELIPIEEAVVPRAAAIEDHENWLDPDAVVIAKAAVQQVWVLGASIGGPEAVREFLARIPRDFPSLFVLAQHLGDEFVGMMTNQLMQATKLTVRTPAHGERVAHGDIVVVPNSHRLLIDAEGVVVLERNTGSSAFSPSIDRVLHDMADAFGAQAGAIIFSGMSSDSADGCRYLAEQGGLVYAQRPDTCVVSSMIDGVCETGVVSFLGSPQELAEKLLQTKP